MTHTIEMKKDKDCKGSVRYAATDPNAVVATVYLSRSAAPVMPETITIEVKI